MIQGGKLAAMCALMCVAAPAAEAQSAARFRFALPRQDLSLSLEAVATITRTNIVFLPSAARGRVAPALNGTYTAAEALRRLLSGSELAFTVTAGGSYVVTARAAERSVRRAPVAAKPPPAPPFPPRERPEEVQDVVVTGSRIDLLGFEAPTPTSHVTRPDLETGGRANVAAALNDLRADYNGRPGLQLVEVAGGYQIVTRPELHEWVRRLFHERSTQKLSVQALESLAVIAYKQPITALEIAEIRGVNTSGVLATLLDRHLIKIVGRKNVVGRPFLYATTKEFLIRFGLNDLKDLPRVEDMAEALGFDPPAGLTEVVPAESVLPLDEPPAPEVS